MDTNQAIQDLRGLVSLYGTEGDIVFAEPWQARAFALALALSERGIFSLRDFQVALIGRINSYEKGQCIAGTGDYYTRWIEALEDLLAQKKLLARERLSLLEHEVVEDAVSRKVHQLMTSRDENGRLRIVPLLVDPGRF
jgi:nitrile hydratase accessory protein